MAEEARIVHPYQKATNITENAKEDQNKIHFSESFTPFGMILAFRFYLIFLKIFLI